MDGTIDGWVGGGCVRPVVLQEAADALTDGRPRLVRMNAGTGADAGATDATRHGDVREYPMTCQGEGGIEVAVAADIGQIDENDVPPGTQLLDLTGQFQVATLAKFESLAEFPAHCFGEVGIEAEKEYADRISHGVVSPSRKSRQSTYNQLRTGPIFAARAPRETTTRCLTWQLYFHKSNWNQPPCSGNVSD